LNIEFYGWLGNLIVATIGAVLLIWIWRKVQGPQTG
ncbi:MAG: GlsB/YeaQ/YmgE family stress response membrane protein, partial [Gammaproteobacteria bacterium]|nr:GlsB/YeaQ/YmgE family stress response membrane protein [Gammaproteobacteria bacterium]